MKYKNSPSLNKFPFILLNNLKFVERRKSIFFSLNYLFCSPLDYAARGRSTTRPHPLSYAPVLQEYE
jgi:hypothetical protein